LHTRGGAVSSYALGAGLGQGAEWSQLRPRCWRSSRPARGINEGIDDHSQSAYW